MEGRPGRFHAGGEANPNSAAGFEDQASVLAEQLGRNREALAPLDRLLELYPAFARAWGARAVVRARLGLRDDALADVRKALELDPASGRSQDQAACAYALTSGEHEADRDEAFRFLCQALQKGYGWEQLARGRGPGALAERPALRRAGADVRVVASGRALKATEPPSGTCHRH